MENHNTLLFIWVVLIVILIVCVFVIGMLVKMNKHEWKQPVDLFKRRHGIDDVP